MVELDRGRGAACFVRRAAVGEFPLRGAGASASKPSEGGNGADEVPFQVGHVVIVFAAGMIYGFWVGCAITAGGTMIGEYIVFVFIRALFLPRAQKFVPHNLAFFLFRVLA